MQMVTCRFCSACACSHSQPLTLVKLYIASAGALLVCNIARHGSAQGASCTPFKAVWAQAPANMSADDIEHTLFVCRQVSLYRVPPKATAGGHKSGEWKVADKIFTGRLKVTAKGEAAEVRLEDADR